MPHYTALVTLLAVLLYFYTGILVAKARGKFGVKAPATSGNADFERVFRVQKNTLEWMPIFLPAAVVFRALRQRLGRRIAGTGLDRRPHPLYPRLQRGGRKRHKGFPMQAFASGALLIGALVGIILRMAHG